MKRYITAFVVFTMLFFCTISTVKAEDCIEIPGDIVSTHMNIQITQEDIDRGYIKANNGLIDVTIKIDKHANPDGSHNAEIVGGFTDNNIDPSTAHFGKESYLDPRDTENHKGDIKYDNLPDNFFAKDFEQDGKNFNAKATTSTGDTEVSNILDQMANAKEYALENKQPWDSNKWASENVTVKSPQKAFQNIVDWGKMTPEQMRKEAQGQRDKEQFAIHADVQRPPTKVCKGDPGWDLCERFASMPKPTKPGNCYNSIPEPSEGACKAYTKDIPISSYTTTSPLPTKPLIKDKDLCRVDDRNQATFETSVSLKKYSGTIKANQKNMQDKAQSLVTQFNEDLWTSKFQTEDRFWNPFQEGVISSGLPVDTEKKKYYTVELDSWEDREYRPNSFLTESIEYVRKKEAINDTVVKKYHGSNINIYNNAPNPKVTHRYLDGKVWKDLYSTNIECGMRYKLLVEPRYKITEHIRRQHKQVREIYGRQKVRTERCNEHDCSELKKEWTGDYDEDGKRKYEWEWVEKTCWDTCCYLEPDNQKQEWNDGETQTSRPAGEIPPVYAPRVKWRYRIGVGNEYHASAKRLTDKAKLTPVPNSKDTQKMKSGYGFKYSGDKWKIVTDYDEPQFKNESDVIRPNKNVALKLTGNIKSQTEYFDPNVKYNSAKNAPERSSSKDSKYIEERIKANKIKSDFNKNAISKFVSKTKDHSSLLRIRPYTKDSSVSGEKIIYRGKAINMETQFEAQSDPNKYYHAYWVTKGEPNLIPAYKQAPLHYVHLDYPSGTMYDIYSINRTYIRNGFTIDAYNTGSIKIVGNMWEDSFSRPNFKK